jgi:imidazoleglycerol-phosphate dehydratase
MILEERRTTKETDIDIKLKLYGSGKYQINTGLPFFDHMLDLFAKHSLIDMDLTCKGDIAVDSHHTVEDVGIVLGGLVKKAMGDCKGIKRYASISLPMDETLARVALDVSGRPFLMYKVDVKGKMESGIEAQVFEEFFRAFVMSSSMTLHIEVLYGENTHHMLEACFKGFARCLRYALEKDPREQGIPSSKGVI